ncbi:MAG: glutamine-hydrolyzing carbamoyl-phosphate synthase small subunit [Bacteroidales bacterium]|nr:glutamine-hydrolyzing carbamoyl-phosphate synthase small subunit [Bacteroidales bacterium]
MTRKPAKLLLGNGQALEGWSFGYDGPTTGEVVFSTSMVGYPESLTDPSFEGQILCVSYPLVGNYGIPDMAAGPDGLALRAESERIHVRGLVIADYSENYSHWDAVESLGDWLRREHVPGISGIDTRALTRMIREEGVMPGEIVIDGCHSEEAACGRRENPENLVARVSCREVLHYGKGPKRVVLVDCGVKHNILRCLVGRNIEVVRVPWDYDFTGMDYDGLFLSNGPGDPAVCRATIDHLRKALQGDRPVFGVCLGSQLMALAAGAKTFKLPYGHRSHNQPVRRVGTDRCYITSQNHGYAVDPATLPEGWEPFFENLNDGTNEGIRHLEKPFFATQFHPEASGGPVDTEFLFDDFLSLL